MDNRAVWRGGLQGKIRRCPDCNVYRHQYHEEGCQEVTNPTVEDRRTNKVKKIILPLAVVLVGIFAGSAPAHASNTQRVWGHDCRPYQSVRLINDRFMKVEVYGCGHRIVILGPLFTPHV